MNDYKVGVMLDLHDSNLPTSLFEENLYITILFNVNIYGSKEDFDNKTNPCDTDTYSLHLSTMVGTRFVHGSTDFSLSDDNRCSENARYIELVSIKFWASSVLL